MVQNWLPLPDTAETKATRHVWVMVRLKRGKDPVFQHTPLPRSGLGQTERSAAIIMTYFHPFTLRPEDADEHVRFVGGLRGRHKML